MLSAALTVCCLGILPVSEEASGPVVDGLQATLRLGRSSYVVGQAIRARLSVRNHGAVARTLYRCGFYTNHRIVVRDEAGAEVAATAVGSPLLGSFDPAGPRRKNLPVDVEAGGEDVQELPLALNELFDLSRPGRYTVSVTYEEPTLAWVGKLSTGVVVFEVKPGL
jgi:hypothetical protein